MAHFVKQIFESDLSFDEKMNYLMCKKQFDPLDDQYFDTILNKINFLLSSTNTRCQGLIVLNLFLEDLSQDQLAKNIGHWLNNCLQFAQYSNLGNKEVAFMVITKLLNSSKDNSNIRKVIGNKNIALLLDLICKNETSFGQNPVYEIKVLLACITIYPAFCISRKSLIERFIFNNCVSFNFESKKLLAKLFAQLHICQTFNSSTNFHKNSWFDHIAQLIVTIDSLLNVYRNNEIDFSDNQMTLQKITPFFDENDCDNFRGLLKATQRYEFISLTLVNMFNDCSSSSIELPILAVLNVISKTCSAQSEIIYKRNSFLACVVSLFQKNALIILDHLIKVCKSNLVVYSKFIHQIFLRMLNNSTFSDSSTRQAASRYNFDLKLITYHVLRNWFQSTGPNLFIDNKISEDLINHFINDIKHTEVTIKLRNVKSLKHTKLDKNISVSKRLCLNKLTFFCVRALKSFLFTCNLSLSSSQFDSTANFIIEEALAVYRNSIDEKSIYSDPCTRKELLSILYFLAYQTRSNLTTPILCIFRQALRIEKNLVIRNSCIQHFTSLNMLLNPRKYVKLINVFSHESLNKLKENKEEEIEEKMNAMFEKVSETNDIKEIGQDLEIVENLNGYDDQEEIKPINNNASEMNKVEQIVLIDDQEVDVELLSQEEIELGEESLPNKKLKYEKNEDCLLLLKDFVNS